MLLSLAGFFFCLSFFFFYLFFFFSFRQSPVFFSPRASSSSSLLSLKQTLPDNISNVCFFTLLLYIDYWSLRMRDRARIPCMKTREKEQLEREKYKFCPLFLVYVTYFLWKNVTQKNFFAFFLAKKTHLFTGQIVYISFLLSLLDPRPPEQGNEIKTDFLVERERERKKAAYWI